MYADWCGTRDGRAAGQPLVGVAAVRGVPRPGVAVERRATAGVVSLMVGGAVLVIVGGAGTAEVAADVTLALVKPALDAVTRTAIVLPTSPATTV